MGEVKIDIPTQETPVEYPIELGKTLLSLVFLGFGFLVTTFSLALTHERVPNRPPLPDIVLDNTTYHAWGLAASEIVIIIAIIIASSTVLLHCHRTIVFRRVALIAGLLYMYRGVTMFVTVLPMSDPNYVCAPKLNHTITFLELMSRVVTIITGGGMSFSDNQKYCGDFIFSGHHVCHCSTYVRSQLCVRTKTQPHNHFPRAHVQGCHHYHRRGHVLR